MIDHAMLRDRRGQISRACLSFRKKDESCFTNHWATCFLIPHLFCLFVSPSATGELINYERCLGHGHELYVNTTRNLHVASNMHNGIVLHHCFGLVMLSCMVVHICTLHKNKTSFPFPPTIHESGKSST